MGILHRTRIRGIISRHRSGLETTGAESNDILKWLKEFAIIGEPEDDLLKKEIETYFPIEYRAYLKETLSTEDNIKCAHCGSRNIRSFDSCAPYHPSKEEIANGVPRIDDVIIIYVACDDCNGHTGIEYNLVPTGSTTKYR